MAEPTEPRPEDEPQASEAGDVVSEAAEGPYPRLLSYQLLTPTAPLAPGADIRVIPLPIDVNPTTGAPVPATWAADPTGRHQLRWWGGQAWTNHVADDGEVGEDPLRAE
jgi:hypothetical protein